MKTARQVKDFTVTLPRSLYLEGWHVNFCTCWRHFEINLGYGFDYPMLLENRSISIYSYNLETVLAEKLETILSRSIANTRMRDFYDIHILISIKQNMFMQDIFRAAISATSKFRDSQYSQDEIKKIIQTIKSSAELESNWYQYQSRNDFAHELAYSDVCSSLEKLIGML